MNYRITLMLLALPLQSFATNFGSFSVTDESLYSALIDTDEDKEINNPTLDRKLFNNVLINQQEDSTNGRVLSIRANNTRATDYYEDGIPLYKTGNGFVDLTMYKAFNTIIEINSGGSIGIYGPSATGGEIYLKSKKIRKGFHTIVNTTLSTNDNYVNIMASKKRDDFYIKFDLNTMKQDHFKVSKNFTNTTIQPTDKRVNSDLAQTDGSLKLGYILNDNSDVAFKISHLESVFGNPIQVYDEPSNAFATNADYSRVDDKKLTSYWFYYNYKKRDDAFKLRAYYDKYKDTFNFYNTPSFSSLKYDESDYEDSRLGAVASLKQSYSKKHKGTLSLSIDRNRHRHIIKATPEVKDYETLDNTFAYKHSYVLNRSLSTMIAGKYKKQMPTVVHQYNSTDIKYKDNEAVDGQVVFDFNKKELNSFYLSLAHKNRFASLRELYPFFPWDNINQNTLPEKSNSFEVGAGIKSLAYTTINFSLYKNSIKDMIVYENSGYTNIEKASIQGFEMRLTNFSLDKHNIKFSYAYTDAVDKDNNKILQIPKSKIYFEDAIRLNSKFECIGSVLYVDSRNDMYNSIRYTLDAYTLFDMQLSFQQNSQWRYKIGAKNLLDTHWEYSHGQVAKGRTLFFTLKYSL